MFFPIVEEPRSTDDSPTEKEQEVQQDGDVEKDWQVELPDDGQENGNAGREHQKTSDSEFVTGILVHLILFEVKPRPNSISNQFGRYRMDRKTALGAKKKPTRM
jgi:hypothetical protein